jgi:hypothetical protein
MYGYSATPVDNQAMAFLTSIFSFPALCLQGKLAAPAQAGTLHHELNDDNTDGRPHVSPFMSAGRQDPRVLIPCLAPCLCGSGQLVENAHIWIMKQGDNAFMVGNRC